jgi:hypothetical protein
MLDYAHGRAIEVLMIPRRAILITNGPAGLQAGEFACEAADLDLYLLVPQTCDHLFNLEYDPTAALLSSMWHLKGEVKVISPIPVDLELELLKEPGVEWCVLVRITPHKLQIRRDEGWGNLETIDL